MTLFFSKHSILCLLFILAHVFSPLFAQPGKDGVGNVSNPNTVVNQYTALSANANAGSFSLSVSDVEGLMSGSVYLSAGDLLLIVQMQGATINQANTNAYGNITAINGAGNYEFVYVASADRVANTITLASALRNTYSFAGRTQVIRVPQYTDLNISSTASIVPAPWNGITGGVVAVHATGTVTNDGSVAANGAGFRGGAINNLGSSTNTGTTFMSTNINVGAEKGESVAGYQADYNLGRYAKGAPANGGGGGSGHNAGGGGGANASNGNTWTGQGVMCASCTGASAWALDPAYIANGNALTNSSGGGRAGYALSANNADALTVAPGNAAWGGDARRDAGGWGGRGLSFVNSENRVFFGGGGGAGHGNNDANGAGGNGGGLIYMVANTMVGSGTFSANGAAGGNTRNTNGDGPGGGGGGGSIIVKAGTVANTLSFVANGGNGGSHLGIANDAYGPGGGGGGGFMALNAGSPTISTVGGSGGTTNSAALTEFPNNGATAGASGIPNATVTLAFTPFVNLTVTNNGPVCAGASASFNVLPAGASYAWSGPNGFNSTSQNPTIASASTASAGNYFVTVTYTGGYMVTGTTALVVGASITSSSASLNCTATSVALTALGNGTFVWEDGSTDAIRNVSATGVYTVTVTGSCVAVAQVTVTSNTTIPSTNITPNNATVTCSSPNVTLTAASGVAFLWDNGATTVKRTVSVAGAYFVTVTGANGCANTASVNVSANNTLSPSITSSSPQLNCTTTAMNLTATSGVSYLWDNNSTAAVRNINAPNTYRVTATGSNGCTATASTVIVRNLATATVTFSYSVANCNFGAISITGSGAGSYLWSDGTSQATAVVPALGTYAVTISSSVTGCTSTAAAIVQPYVVAPSISTDVTNTTCTDFPLGAIVVNNQRQGLSAEYFNNMTLSGAPVYTGLEAPDFNWGTNAPNGFVNANQFSARWKGQVRVPVTGVYTFATNSDDGIRLYVDGALVINNWTDHSAIINTAPTVTFAANSVHDIVMEYYENGGYAIAQLLWSYPGQPQTSIPASNLAPTVLSYSLNGGPAQFTNIFNQLPDGPYTIVATDPFGCTASSSTAVQLVSTPPSVVFSPANPLVTCRNARVTVTATNNFNYVWGNGSTSNSVTANGAATFAVTGTNANGCTASNMVTVGVSTTAPVISVATNIANCDFSSITLTGTPDNTYVWSNGTTQRSNIVNAFGSYPVTATNIISGCTATTSVVVQPLVVAPSITTEATNTTCTAGPMGAVAVINQRLGLSAEYFGNVSLTGAPIYATVERVNLNITGFPTNAAVGANNFSARWRGQVLAPVAGSYQFSTLSDDGIRMYVDGVLVINNWTYHGQTLDLSPSITFAANSVHDIVVEFFQGTGGYVAQLMWSYPGQSQTLIPLNYLAPTVLNYSLNGGPFQTNNFFNNLNDGPYTVVARDVFGCTASSSTSVQVVGTPPSVVFSPANPIISCVASRVTVTASNNYSYVWGSGSTSNSVTANSAATFMVTGTNANGCTVASSVTVGVSVTPPVVAFAYSVSNCNFANASITASGATNYVWDTGASGATIQANGVGVYVVTATNNISGCSATAAANVQASAGQPSFTASVTNVTCPGFTGGAITLTNTRQGLFGEYFGNMTLSGPVIYSTTERPNNNWGGSTPNAAVPVDRFSARWRGQVLAPVAGAYVFATNSDDGIRLYVDGVLVINNWTDHGATINTAASITFAANSYHDIVMEYYENTGSAIAQLLWSYPGQAQTAIPNNFLTPSLLQYSINGGGFQSSSVFTGLTNSIYSVVARDGFACTVSNNVNVSSTNPAPSVALSASTPNLNCTITSIGLTASGATSYAWSTGATSSAITVTNAGTYTVTGTSAIGCTASRQYVVTSDNTPPTLSIYPALTQIDCNQPTVLITVSGGATYRWNTGATTASITASSAGAYPVTVTGTNGCTSTIHSTVIGNFVAPPTGLSISNPTLTCGLPTTTISAPTGGYTYLWSTGSTFSSITIGAAGTYQVTISSPNGCTAVGNSGFIPYQDLGVQLTSLPVIDISATCDKGNGWTYYQKPGTPGAYFFAIRWGTNNGTSKASAKVEVGVRNNVYSSTGLLAGKPAGTWAMARYWNVSVTQQPSEPVSIRFYYANSEKVATEQAAANFAAANPNSALESPTWFKTLNGLFDPNTMLDPNGVAVGNNQPLTPNYGIEDGIEYVQFDNLSHFSGGTYASGVGKGNPLPLTLMSFRGVNEAGEHRLSWETATEQNTSHFEVEHSSNGLSFKKLGSVQASINSRSLRYYGFNHMRFNPEANYYRLKMVDADGAFTYSNTIVLQGPQSDKEADVLSVYPNPTDGLLSIDLFFEGQPESQLSVKVYDLLGREVMRDNPMWSNILTLNTEVLESGTYVLEVSTENGPLYRGKFVKTN